MRDVRRLLDMGGGAHLLERGCNTNLKAWGGVFIRQDPLIQDSASI